LQQPVDDDARVGDDIAKWPSSEATDAMKSMQRVPARIENGVSVSHL
jgi:hypothetical protein